jgi:ornithine cyclodeaminase/alanine dehydrogenase-like protein (mu-crystallin family)
MIVVSDEAARSLVSSADAVAAAERVLGLPSDGGKVSELGLHGGRLAVVPALDRDRELALVDATTAVAGEATHWTGVVIDLQQPALRGVVDGGWIAALAAGATSAVAARRLARLGASSIGLVGSGQLAAAALACLRAGIPGLDRAVVYGRDRGRREAFCRRHEAEAAEYGKDAAEQDIVVVATSSPDPAVRGDWLRPGSFVCASGATTVRARELDNAVLERAAFVCCDSLGDARYRAGDLTEPVERGVLDWLEVHELSEILRGEVEGRQREDDVVVLKQVGVPTLRLELARLALERESSA